MRETWVVVADAGRARIFGLDRDTGTLAEREDFAHHEARLNERRLVSDRQGQLTNSSGRHHAVGGEVSPRDEEDRHFAEDIAGRLNHARAAGSLERIMLVAPPRFLGLLREKLDDGTRKRVDVELALDLTALPAEEIRERITGRA